MPHNKRSKRSRQRGSWTHGWGAKKKHRGKGNKGGAGMAGTGKRADSKKPSIWKDPNYFGKHGFASRFKKEKAVNVQYLNEAADSLVEQKLIEKKGDMYRIELSKLGFGKLLSKGPAVKKFEIFAARASPGAIEAVKAAGGSVAVQSADKPGREQAEKK